MFILPIKKKNGISVLRFLEAPDLDRSSEIVFYKNKRKVEA